MTLAKAIRLRQSTFIVQASFTIVTYDCQNIFIIQATARAFALFVSKVRTYQCRVPYGALLRAALEKI
jgi:hypothetical protein